MAVQSFEEEALGVAQRTPLAVVMSARGTKRRIQQKAEIKGKAKQDKGEGRVEVRENCELACGGKVGRGFGEGCETERKIRALAFILHHQTLPLPKDDNPCRRLYPSGHHSHRDNPCKMSLSQTLPLLKSNPTTLPASPQCR